MCTRNLTPFICDSQGGAPDLTTASRIILRDWSTGRIPRYTIPAAAPPTQQSDARESNDENVLATLIPRKELRKTSGLVKLQSGEVDKRKVGLEMDWVVEKDELKGENGDIDGEDEEEGVDEDEEGEEDASDEEEEEDDEQDDALILSGKRKRKSTKQPLPTKPKKSVAFAVEPKRQKRQSLKTTTTTTTSKQTTQKPLKTKSTAMGGMKSSLKKSNAAKVVGKTPKVVNSSVSSSSGKGKAQVAVSTGGEEAYDFKKFF